MHIKDKILIVHYQFKRMYRYCFLFKLLHDGAKIIYSKIFQIHTTYMLKKLSLLILAKPQQNINEIDHTCKKCRWVKSVFLEVIFMWIMCSAGDVIDDSIDLLYQAEWLRWKNSSSYMNSFNSRPVFDLKINKNLKFSTYSNS